MAAPDRIALTPARLFARARTRLFAGPGASLVTLILLGALAWAGWRLLAWGVIDAVAAPDYAACKSATRSVLGLRRREVAPDRLRPLPLRTAMAACTRDRRGAGDAGRERAAGALVAARRARARPRLVDRARPLLHADVRRRVRPRARRHRPLGRPSAHRDPDTDRHGRIDADRRRARARTALVARAAALARHRLHRARARRAADHRAVRRDLRVPARPSGRLAARSVLARRDRPGPVPGGVHGGDGARRPAERVARAVRGGDVARPRLLADAARRHPAAGAASR